MVFLVTSPSLYALEVLLFLLLLFYLFLGFF